jgi:hypothetical protein
MSPNANAASAQLRVHARHSRYPVLLAKPAHVHGGIAAQSGTLPDIPEKEGRAGE